MGKKEMALLRRIAVAGLCVALSLNCLGGGVSALTAEKASAENLLYFVDAGGDGTGVTDGMGSAQSVWDQAYGVDATTGMAWGYEGEASAYSGADYWGSVRVDEQDTPGKGITYRFQLEPGLYRVEVGMKEHWSNNNRATDIRVEGKVIETGVIPKEHEGGVSVTSISALPDGDNDLTVEIVRSSSNDGANEDPLVSYIRIESQEQYTSFTGVEGRPYYDTNGVQIQAHGGQIQQFTVDGQTKYYWVGEDKTNDYHPVDGIHVYSSTDLYNWTDEGLALKTMSSVEDIENDEYFQALYGDLNAEERTIIFSSLDRNNSVIERPKMLYNESTKKYVIWFHADNGSYSKADAGVAVADSPTGPFRLLGTYDLNYVLGMNQGFDGEGHLGAVRDMNLFQDDDGTAYIIYSSQGNQTTFISKLNDAYTGLSADRDSAVRGVDFEIAFAGASREAPAMFKYDGTYYMINSGCTGWDPNEAQYAVADHPFGPWQVKGNPCVGTDADKTFYTQSTCVVPVDAEAGKFLYMGDRWTKGDLSESRYVWLPVKFQPGNKLEISPMSNWTLEELDGNGLVTFTQPLFERCDDLAEFAAGLPQIAQLRWNGQNYKDQAITWDNVSQECYVGQYTVMGIVTSEGPLNGKTVSHTAWIANSDTLYFFDCGAETSRYFDVLAQAAELRNGQPDQAYSAENGAGYLGIVDTDFGLHDGSSHFENGWWAEEGKIIAYQFDHLEAGSYAVTTGYRDWWAKWTDYRSMRVKVTNQESQILASKEITLRDDDLLNQLKFTLKEADSITVTIEKIGGADQVLSLIGLSRISGNEVPKEPERGQLKASFHLVSDVHISDWKGENTEAYIAGMQFMATLNQDTNIAFIDAGDFTNNAQKSEYNAFYVTTRRYNPVDPARTLILLGNHDVRGYGSSWNTDPNGSFPYWETAKALYASHNRSFMPSDAQENLYHAKKLGGYTFLMLNTEKGLKDAMYMSDEQLAWFEALMKASYEEDPTRPVFIICHQALNDTHVRSNVLDGFDGINGDGTPNNHNTGIDARVKEIMAKYPVGIFLSGHIHNGLGYAEAIAREYGVCVDLPSYNASENGYREKGAGYEVMVYENEIVFEGYNFATGKRLPEYDLVVRTPFISALYQEAVQEATRTDVYAEEEIATLQNAISPVKALLNRYYDQSDLAWDDASEPETFLYHPDDWEKINAAAAQLQQVLDTLQQN